MQEFRTAALVAEHLESLGIEVQTGVGGTGVVGVLEGGRPGPVVALRADMDGLPVTEMVDVCVGDDNACQIGDGHTNRRKPILQGLPNFLRGVPCVDERRLRVQEKIRVHRVTAQCEWQFNSDW